MQRRPGRRRKVAETPPAPLLQVEVAEVRTFPQILDLHPDITAGHPLLRLRLRVRWAPEAPAAAFARVRGRLARLSPSLRRHRCGGGGPYRIDGSAGRGDSHDTGDVNDADFEAPLALAHLVEHLIIDVVGYVAGPRKVAGVTGAPVDSTDTFDIFVECDDLALAAVGVPLALAWVRHEVEGTPLDGAGPPALELARDLYQARPDTVNAAEARVRLGRRPEEMERALVWLEQQGYACRIPYAMNLSATPYIRVCGRSAGGGGTG